MEGPTEKFMKLGTSYILLARSSPVHGLRQVVRSKRNCRSAEKVFKTVRNHAELQFCPQQHMIIQTIWYSCYEHHYYTQSKRGFLACEDGLREYLT